MFARCAAQPTIALKQLAASAIYRPLTKVSSKALRPPPDPTFSKQDYANSLTAVQKLIGLSISAMEKRASSTKLPSVVVAVLWL